MRVYFPTYLSTLDIISNIFVNLKGEKNLIVSNFTSLITSEVASFFMFIGKVKWFLNPKIKTQNDNDPYAVYSWCKTKSWWTPLLSFSQSLVFISSWISAKKGKQVSPVIHSPGKMPLPEHWSNNTEIYIIHKPFIVV